MRSAEKRRRYSDEICRGVSRDITKTDAGARIVELNQAATWAVLKLHGRAQVHGAIDSDHHLLPADLSRHTKSTDPLKGGRGFDVSRHQISWDSAWRSLRNAAADAIIEKANEERREPTEKELESVKKLRRIRFHDLRHTFITLMAERGVPLPVVREMVGHMSEAMIRHYTHISNEAARNAVELLDGDRKHLYVGNHVGEFTTESALDSKPLN